MTGAISGVAGHLLPELKEDGVGAEGDGLTKSFTSMLGGTRSGGDSLGAVLGGGQNSESGQPSSGGTQAGTSAVPQGPNITKDPDSTASKLVHTGLDLGGLVPGLGIVTEGANAALYASQGQYGNAVLSGASAIPGVGDITDAGRLGNDVIGLVKLA